MTGFTWFTGNRSRVLGCLLAAISVACITVIDSAISNANLPLLLTKLPIALAVGMLLGYTYFKAMDYTLPRLEKQNAQSLWAGLTWFNLSTLSLWLLALPIPLEYANFGIGFTFSGGCARLTSSVYTVFGASLSNRRRFSNTFVLLTLTIMLVISVVKTSLALSLGLVGALSIIRFRTAIKEPEELAFLFFTVAIGLGFGAGKFGITLSAFWAISVGFIWFRRIQSSTISETTYLVTVYGPDKSYLGAVEGLLENNGFAHEFSRLETNDNSSHVCFLVEIETSSDLQKLNEKLYNEFPNANMTMVQARSLV